MEVVTRPRSNVTTILAHLYWEDYEVVTRPRSNVTTIQPPLEAGKAI